MERKGLGWGHSRSSGMQWKKAIRVDESGLAVMTRQLFIVRISVKRNVVITRQIQRIAKSEEAAGASCWHQQPQWQLQLLDF